MEAEGLAATRRAEKLVERAKDAFARGDDQMGRELVQEAARAFEATGAWERAAVLLRAHALEAPPPPPGARAARAAVPGLAVETSSVDEGLLPPPGAPPGSSVVAVMSMDEPDTGELATDLIGVGKVRAPAPVVEDGDWARLGQALEARLGRAPLTADVPIFADEAAAAAKLGARAYAAQLRRIIEQLSPGHPATHAPEPEAERPSPEPERFELHIHPPVEALEGLIVEELGSDVVSGDDGDGSLDGLAGDIAAAISELAEDGPSSAPLDVPLTVPTSERTPSTDLSGRMLRGRFQLEKVLGRGAQAQVYLARDQVLEREVAVKILDPKLVESPEALEGFLGEARLAAQVLHPGTLSVFDFGREGDLTFLAMELFRGRTLRSLLRGGPLEPYLALYIGRSLCEALDAVHAAGIVHRDVKPSNMLVDRNARSKLTDFGVAIRLQDPFEEGMMVGTLRYMAPEQARGKAPDPRADLFSLGTVIWEMLAGRHAFEPTVQAVKDRMGAPPPALPDSVDVPPAVASLLRRCMAPRVEDRPGSAGRVAARLERCLGKLRSKGGAQA